MSKRQSSHNGETATVKTPEERAAEKRARFLRHAERRTNAAVKAMSHVARHANRQTYTYTEEEGEAIGSALATACEGVLAAFAPLEKVAELGFRLPQST